MLRAIIKYCLIGTLSSSLALTSALAENVIGSGSGFYVNQDNWIVTNAHVVRDCQYVSVKNVGDVKIHSVDDINDLALLKPHSESALSQNKFITFRKAPAPLGGDVVAIGYPLADILSDSVKVTVGHVNAVAGLHNDTRYLQISAPIQPGNSGGPLLDKSGRLIGINTSTLAKGVSDRIKHNTQNINFSLRASVVTTFLEANAIRYIESYQEQPPLPTKEIAKIGAEATVQVLCHGGAKHTNSKTTKPQYNENNQKTTRANDMREAITYDAMGFDYATVKDTSFSTCKYICQKESKCKAVTYNKRHRVCFLKNDALLLVRHPDALAAYKPVLDGYVYKTNMTVFDNYDVVGGDYKKYSKSSFPVCAAECITDSTCEAFSYVKKNRTCWLKNRIANKGRKTKGVTFGIK